jgi:hypothetical protein
MSASGALRAPAAAPASSTPNTASAGMKETM